LELKEEIRINAPRDEVFAALNDVEILKRAIPGCEAMEAISDTEFIATVTSKVGPLKARFKGQVTLSDVVAPESYTLIGEGKGGPAGHAKIRSRVRLVEDGQATIMHYDVKADIGGKLAQLGGHLVEKTSKKLAAEFFQKFEEMYSRRTGRLPSPKPAKAAPACCGSRAAHWF
jgi:uncharacterized protein